MSKNSILDKLGLSSHEASVYISLVELGPSTVSDIARKTGLHRPTIYQVLPNLIKLELISSSSKGKRKLYVAESPEKLKVLLDRTKQQLNEFIPYLVSIYSSREKKPLVKFIEGQKGIASVFDDLVESLPRGSVFYRYSSIQKSDQTEKYLPKDYRTRRDHKQLERFVITNEEVAQRKKPRLERDIKAIPKSEGLFNQEVTEIIYGNKIAFIDYNSETVLVIENQKIVDFQKAIFKALYRRL